MKTAQRVFLITLTLALAFEKNPFAGDPFGQLGLYLLGDLKSSTPIPIAFSIVELALISAFLIVLAANKREKKQFPFQRGRLVLSIVCFGAAMALATLWGLSRGGDNLTFALFEVRACGILVFAYFLVGLVLHDEQDINRLVWCILIGCTWLTCENLYRYFVIFHRVLPGDLAFDHDDSVLLAFTIILCLAMFAFGGTRGQKRYAVVVLPVMVLCLAVMQRRAAFAALDVGAIVLALILFRLRPRLFWRVIPPLAVVGALYLAIFWNSTSTYGQAARAVHSVFSPDPRDAASNLYRNTERFDILANIQTSRIMGLGLGQQFIFYYPLPDLSWWPFWHYTPHNSILWLYMDGGLPAFFTFWWVAGSGLYYGGQELLLRREAWSLLQQLRERQKHGTNLDRRVRSRTVTRSTGEPQGLTGLETREREAILAQLRDRLAARPGAQAAIVPRDTALTALLAAGICLISMEVVYAYVEPGMNSTRCLLLLGVLLGVMGRSYITRPSTQRTPRRRRSSRSVGGSEPGQAGSLPFLAQVSAARPTPHASSRSGVDDGGIGQPQSLDHHRTSTRSSRDNQGQRVQ